MIEYSGVAGGSASAFVGNDWTNTAKDNWPFIVAGLGVVVVLAFLFTRR